MSACKGLVILAITLIRWMKTWRCCIGCGVGPSRLCLKHYLFFYSFIPQEWAYYSILLFPKNEPIILIGDVSSIIYQGLFYCNFTFPWSDPTLSMQVMFGILIYKETDCSLKMFRLKICSKQWKLGSHEFLSMLLQSCQLHHTMLKVVHNLISIPFLHQLLYLALVDTRQQRLHTFLYHWYFSCDQLIVWCFITRWHDQYHYIFVTNIL